LLKERLTSMKLSVGIYMGVLTACVLLAVTVVTVFVLTSQERRRERESKQDAAVMVTELFGASISAGLIFRDTEAVGTELDNLKSTEGVIAAAAYVPEEAVPFATFGDIGPRGSDTARTESDEDSMTVTRPVRARGGVSVGTVRVRFSLARENASLAQSRRTFAIGGLVVVLVALGLITTLSQRNIVNPLMRLAEVAKRIERGNLEARAEERGSDELATLARTFNSMGRAIEQRETQLRAELQVAADLQTSILPEVKQVPGIEWSASMQPATEVGGDYYDVIPVANGCWIGIGDVSGHGLGAGVIMLMIQSAIAAVVRANPTASPVQVECIVNEILFENIRIRMKRRDHATLSILRYDNDGKVRYAGAHETILVFRAETGTVEQIETPGTWVGAIKTIQHATVESAFVLQPEDVLLLYSDGVTEAMNNRVQFGLERLIDILRSNGRNSTEEIRRAVTSAVQAFATSLTDDVSVVVMRRRRSVS
jgi:sigma-B regulation protein RsbU (phosphoserine phosphatase)